MVSALTWALITGVAGLALLAVQLTSGFLHHALRQARGRKHTPQPARAYVDAVATELAAIGAILARTPRGLIEEPPTPEHDPPGGPPILIAPEAGLPWTAAEQLIDQLEAHGFTNVHVLPTWPTTASLATLGERLEERVRALTEAAERGAVVIGHGLPGLALRWAYEHGAEGRIQHLITVGTPHAGTRTPRHGLGGGQREIRPGAAFLAELDEHPLVASTTLFSHVDDAIVPARSARWGDQAVAVPGVGHLGLIWEERSTRVILAAVVAAVSEAVQGQGS